MFNCFYQSQSWGTLSWGPPTPRRSALGLAASRSMARNTWKLRPLKPWENRWETDRFYRHGIGFSCRSLVESKLLRSLRIAKWLAKKSVQGHPVQSYSNSTTVFQKTPGVHSTL